MQNFLYYYNEAKKSTPKTPAEHVELFFNKSETSGGLWKSVLRDFKKQLDNSMSGAPQKVKDRIPVFSFFKLKYENEASSNSKLIKEIVQYVKEKLTVRKITKSYPQLQIFFTDSRLRNYYSTNISKHSWNTTVGDTVTGALTPSEEKLYEKYWNKVYEYLKPSERVKNIKKREENVQRYKELDEKLQEALRNKQEAKVINSYQKQLNKLEVESKPHDEAYGVYTVWNEVKDFPYFVTDGLDLAGVLLDEKLKSVWKSLKPSSTGHYSDFELFLWDTVEAYGSNVSGLELYQKDLASVVAIQAGRADETTKVLKNLDTGKRMGTGGITRRKEQKREAGELEKTALDTKKTETVIVNYLDELYSKIEQFRKENLGDALLPYPTEKEFKSELESSPLLKELYSKIKPEKLQEFKKQLWRELLLPAHRENAERALKIKRLLETKKGYKQFLKNAGIRNIISRKLERSWDEEEPTVLDSEVTNPTTVVPPKKTGTEWWSTRNPTRISDLIASLEVGRSQLGPKNQAKIDAELQSVLSATYDSYDEFYSVLSKKVASLVKRIEKVVDKKQSEVVLTKSVRNQLTNNFKEGVGELSDYADIAELMGATSVYGGEFEGK